MLTYADVCGLEQLKANAFALLGGGGGKKKEAHWMRRILLVDNGGAAFASKDAAPRCDVC